MTTTIPRGPGLFKVDHANGSTITNIRRLAGTDRAPGSVLVASAGFLLAALAAGLLFVSFAGQFKYIFSARQQQTASVIEALMFDVGMIIFSLLALGLARAGKSARTERILVMLCSLGSAAMNYSAADTASPRSVVAYVAAPVFLAVVVDRVVAVIRRHVLPDAEASPWTGLGRAVGTAGRLAGMIVLYVIRIPLAPAETIAGFRTWVLVTTPLPQASPPIPPASVNAAITSAADATGSVTEPAELEGASKKARLAWWYRRDADYGNRSAVAASAKRLAPLVDLSEGTARAYIAQILADLEKAGEAP